MKNKLPLTLSLLLLLLFILNACKKKDDTVTPVTTTTPPTTTNTPTNTPPTNPPVAATIPTADIQSSLTHESHQYHIIKQAKTWIEAAAYATQYGFHLIHIKDETEQRAIEAHLKVHLTELTGSTAPQPVPNGGDAEYLWIGANDKEPENTWIWDGDNKTPTEALGTSTTKKFPEQRMSLFGTWTMAPGAYANWGINRFSNSQAEPNDLGDNQDFAAIALNSWDNGNRYQWNDIDGINKLWFIIKKD